MIFIGEDTKVSIDDFYGLYSRGSSDEVPTNHAADCLNIGFTSSGHAKTRSGLIKSITLPQGGGIQRFFVMTAIPTNIGEPVTSNPGSTDGDGLLWLSGSGNLYIGNDPTAKMSVPGDFCALNIANRTYLSPNSGKGGYIGGKLQIINSLTGAFKQAAGFAPEQPQNFSMVATVSASAGNVPSGRHKFAVIYETDTGFWTQPGPKIYYTCIPTAGNPTVFAAGNHGMITGESHRMITDGTWGNPTVNFSDAWHITRIDDAHFSLPVDSSGFGPVVGNFQIAGGVEPAEVIADGAHKIDIGAIPVGPAGTTKRIIIGTRADELEYFFIPDVPGSGSIIDDNTTTSTTVNFDDTDLVDSADYLFDILEAIPSGSSMCKYRNRLVITGPYLPGGLQERVLVSNIGDFETFNWVNGYIQVQSERDSNDVMSCYVLRDTLYLAKFVGTFATEDNGNFPSTWAVTVVDATIGNYCHGISNFTETQMAADTGDVVIVASRSGLYLFDGVMRRPELSWKIEALWRRINPNYFYKVTVAHDPWHHLIYVAAPIDSATSPSSVLVCDYSDGRTFDKVRWSIFQFHKNPTCLGMVYFGSTESPTEYTLKVGSIDTGPTYLYSLEDTASTDDGNIIKSTYTPGPVYLGGVGCFKLLHFRAWGVGRINMTINGLDDILAVTPQYLALSPSPGREYDRQVNFVNEKMNLKITNGDSLNDYIVLDRIDTWGLQLWPIRPSV